MEKRVILAQCLDTHTHTHTHTHTLRQGTELPGAEANSTEVFKRTENVLQLNFLLQINLWQNPVPV